MDVEEKDVAKVKLMCGVDGEGSVFSVNIERSADVEALQKEIARVVSTEQHAVPPRLVTLYLARKDRQWLQSDAKLEGFLKLGRQEDGGNPYEKMIPNWNLGENYLRADFEPGPKQIHVLVELPAKQPPASVKKQLRYKGMSTEASCQKFLDALARELAVYYDFDFYYTVPTIGDVFRAVDDGSWAFRVKKRKALRASPPAGLIFEF